MQEKNEFEQEKAEAQANSSLVHAKEEELLYTKKQLLIYCILF